MVPYEIWDHVIFTQNDGEQPLAATGEKVRFVTGEGPITKGRPWLAHLQQESYRGEMIGPNGARFD
jgi:hypothetical protein